jgi:signal transduction histidine kinase
MTNVRRWGRHVVAPISAVVYFGFWVASTWGNGGVADNAVVFGLFAMAIGLAYWMPVTALVLVVVVPVLQLFGIVEAPREDTWGAYVAIALVMFFVAVRPSPWLRLAALLIAAGVAALGAWLLAVPTITRPYVWSSWVGTGAAGGLRLEFSLLTAALFGVFAGAWAIGVAFASIRRVLVIRRALEATETRFEATDFELRIAQERARISRDVHDALAHSLAVVVSQAQGAIALQHTRPEVTAESLQNIADVGRTALLDVRRLVERITQDDDVTAPRETLADIDGLVSAMSEVGMDIVVTSVGEPGDLAPSQELAVYRIVQESLTNALKHAGTTSKVVIALDWREPGLSLLVTSRGRGAPLVAARTGVDRGAGVRGMTERARLAGGWLTAQPSSDGSAFEVTVFVPTRRRADSARTSGASTGNYPRTLLDGAGAPAASTPPAAYAPPAAHPGAAPDERDPHA